MTYLPRHPPLNFYTELFETVAANVPADMPQLGLEVCSVGDFARMIRRRRSRTGLSQEALAQRAGVGRRFLIDLEREKATVQAAELLRVCQAAGLKITIAVSEPVRENPRK